MLVAALAWSSAVSADSACEGFKWDVSREHRLFMGEATAATAGKSLDDAPVLQLDRLYELGLSPQPDVRLPVPSSKKMLADGANAGLVRLKLSQAGQYRVALSMPFWIDIAANGQLIPSIDFNGAQGCDKPRKVVIYDLPANQDLSLQFSGLTDDKLRVTLTAVAPTK